MESRQERGLEIAKQKGVKASKNGWTTQNQSGNRVYYARADVKCGCPDCQSHQTIHNGSV